MDVILDANVYLSDVRMESIRFKNLFDYLRRTGSRLVVPRLVREEVVAKYARMFAEQLKKIEQAEREFNRLSVDGASTIQFQRPDLNSAKRNLRRKFSSPARQIKAHEYADVAKIDVNEVFLRGANRRKPASESGEELRDVIIWLIALQYGKESNRDVAFVSQDSGFWDGIDVHPHILEDIAQRKVKVRVFRSIDEFVKQSAPAPSALTASESSSLFALEPHLEAVKAATQSALQRGVQGTITSLEITSTTFTSGELYQIGSNTKYVELSYDLLVKAEWQRPSVSPSSLLRAMKPPSIVSLETHIKKPFSLPAGAVRPALSQIGQRESAQHELPQNINRFIVVSARASIFARLVNDAAAEVEIDTVDVLSLDATLDALGGPPSGFRNLDWDAPPPKRLKKYSETTDDGLSMYIPESMDNLPLLFGVSPVEEAYSFEFDKFYSGHAWFDGELNFHKIKAALTAAFGPPSFTNERLQISKWKWSKPRIEIQFYFQEKHKKSTLEYMKEDDFA